MSGGHLPRCAMCPPWVHFQPGQRLVHRDNWAVYMYMDDIDISWNMIGHEKKRTTWWLLERYLMNSYGPYLETSSTFHVRNSITSKLQSWGGHMGHGHVPKILAIRIQEVMNLIMILYTLWLFNIAMENDPSIDDFPIKTSIYSGFPMAMLNNQMVTSSKCLHNYGKPTCYKKWGKLTISIWPSLQ